MKPLLFLVFLLPVTTGFSQFTKKFYPSDSTKLRLTDTVVIKTGHGKNMNVFVTASCPTDIWNKYVIEKKISDSSYFHFIVTMLAIKAQYSLKNSDSFEPFETEFFMWYDKSQAFTSSFKLMGRNGYGNQIESSVLVEYDPKKAD